MQTLSYAYSTQVHHLTDTSPYRMVVSRPPPELPLKHTTTTTTYTLKIPALQYMRRQITARLAMLQVKFDGHMWSRQVQYESDHNCRTREIPSLQLCSYVFFDNPPLATTPKPSAGALVSSNCNKFQRRTSELNLNLKVRTNIVSINK